MTVLEQALLAALKDLDRTVAEILPGSPKPNLLPVFARLDELTSQLPQNTDQMLLHFLHRKSYEKARLWLEARHAETVPGAGH